MLDSLGSCNNNTITTTSSSSTPLSLPPFPYLLLLTSPLPQASLYRSPLYSSVEPARPESFCPFYGGPAGLYRHRASEALGRRQVQICIWWLRSWSNQKRGMILKSREAAANFYQDRHIQHPKPPMQSAYPESQTRSKRKFCLLLGH